MDPILDPIASPTRVAPPAHVLGAVRARIRRHEMRTRRWLRAAAAAAVLVWASTGYLFLSESPPAGAADDADNPTLTAFVDLPDNSLYGE